MAEAKRFSFKLWNVRQVTLTGSSSEKLIVRLSSQTLPQLQQDFKISLDDVRGRLDVELNRRGDVSRAAAREGLDVTIELPQAYVRRAELKTVADLLAVGPLACEDLEVDGKLQSLLVDGFSGALEINCNQDMQIDCRALTGSLDVNQLSAITRVRIGRDMPVSARCRGLGNSLYFERGGQSVPDFSDPEAETVIELNGVKSELFICAD